jgi:transketolase
VGVPRLAIETGITLAWSRYVCPNGSAIGLDRFGASAPAKTLFEQFGFTVDNVVKQVHELVARKP